MESALWLSLGLLAGTAQMDPRLADYQWDVSPRAAWGAQALVGRHGLALGLRLWRTRSEQTVDPASPDGRPGVGVTSSEMIGRGRVAAVWGTHVWADAGGGLLHIGYDPDQVVIASGGSPVVVDLKPVNTWSAGGGMALERPLGGAWSASLEVGRRWYALETAHRNGNAIETGRQRFGDWTARLELARLWGRP